MFKKLFLALALLLPTQLQAAGTIPLSMTQQLDTSGKPLAGGLLYLFAAGTTTPQNAYSDSGLTTALPNPITLDSAGRLPQFFLADGSIKIRLTNSVGVIQVAADGILVVGASSGGGGGSPVDATTVLATGDVKSRYGTGTLSGFVRLNGRTIGSVTSGATERANADTQTLFEYLWNTDSALSVSTGRGVSSIADWNANKNIALPDGRGRVLAALDDMGTTAAGRLTSTYLGSTPTTLGAVGGVQAPTILTANLPAYTPSGTFGGTFSGSGTAATGQVSNFTAGSGPVAITFSGGVGSAATYPVSVSTTISGNISGTAQGGLSTPIATLPPMLLITNYIKL